MFETLAHLVDTNDLSAARAALGDDPVAMTFDDDDHAADDDTIDE